MRWTVVTAYIVLGACTAEPRSQSYFVAHPQEADHVLAECGLGNHRGEECINAEASVIDRERKARMEMAKRGFKEQW